MLILVALDIKTKARATIDTKQIGYACWCKCLVPHVLFVKKQVAKLCQDMMVLLSPFSNACVKRPLSKRQKNCFNANYRLMQVISIPECSKGGGRVAHSAIILTFTKLPLVIKI